MTGGVVAEGRDKGGLLKPDDICSKTGNPVHEVLQLKHLEPTVPPKSALKYFESVLMFCTMLLC
eukprot:15360560-Ditylum_brightwellii.AAC.1